MSTLFAVLGILTFYFVCIIGLFYLTTYLDYSADFPANSRKLNLPVTIPAFLHLVLYVLCESFIYDNLSLRLTDYENH
jgi:hypothetical protein